MPQTLPYLAETASQTAGPYVHIGLAPEAAGLQRGPAGLGRVIAGPATPGARIRVAGMVLDGLGAPVRDALIELWQADAQGRHADGSGDFRGWGRAATDLATGRFAFDTIRPGPTPGHGGRMQAPHLSLWIVARGVNIALHTRMYFPGDEHAGDPALARVEPARRGTLIAAAEGPDAFRFDIRLQGDGETVFLDI